MNSSSLYRHLIAVTEDYLGPAAERFINRQIENHLQKNPDQIDKDDLPQLVQWAKLSLAVLTDNKALVAEYAERLENFNSSTSAGKP